MAPSYTSLVKEAIVLLDKFSADRQSLDDFLGDAFKDLQDMDTPQQKFILDVVSGCIEHKKLLDVVTGVFFSQNGKVFSRGDYNQLVIICYLTMFALDDLGLEHFSTIVKSLNTKMIRMFLIFFFTNLTTWIQGEWSKIYDYTFVEKHWIEPLLRWRPEIDILIDQLVCGRKLKKAPVKTTKPKEFSLTKPKPPSQPMPELIPQLEKCKPVPESTYRPPKEKQKIEEIKKKNQQRNKELLYEAELKQFRCVNPQKSERTKKVMSQIQMDFDSKLKFDSFRASGFSPSDKIHRPIKLNSAAILRQRALYDRQVEEELQKMQRLVEGGGEPSSFLQWQREMRERDLQLKLASIECRRLEGRIGYEEAVMARAHIMEHNQKAAQRKKEETAEIMRIYAEQRLLDEKEMRDLVQQVAEGHKNVKMAKEKLQKFKQNTAKEFSEQNQELVRQALDEAQAELIRKFELIQEIHAYESLPRVRFRDFEDTATAGHGLLEEMSLAELKERLARLKEAQGKEQHEKREHILKQSHLKKQLLLEDIQTIELHRRAMARAAAVRKEEERKARLDLQEKVSQDETLLTLQRKFEEKQQERQRLRCGQRKMAKTTKKMAAHTATITEKPTQKTKREIRWTEMKISTERQIQEAAQLTPKAFKSFFLDQTNHAGCRTFVR